MDTKKTGGTGGDWEVETNPIKMGINAIRNLIKWGANNPLIVLTVVGAIIATIVKLKKKK